MVPTVISATRLNLRVRPEVSPLCTTAQSACRSGNRRNANNPRADRSTCRDDRRVAAVRASPLPACCREDQPRSTRMRCRGSARFRARGTVQVQRLPARRKRAGDHRHPLRGAACPPARRRCGRRSTASGRRPTSTGSCLAGSWPRPGQPAAARCRLHPEMRIVMRRLSLLLLLCAAGCGLSSPITRWTSRAPCTCRRPAPTTPTCIRWSPIRMTWSQERAKTPHSASRPGRRCLCHPCFSPFVPSPRTRLWSSQTRRSDTARRRASCVG